ncbi:antitoxin [Synechococcus sp. PCC 6312]|uniref:antitoxin n=1 Tax=Synechococcus sp. (strain ATCC 27167 / PCC 6312) TaxID=195253 RepID=UPI00029EC466|nr:virulence-associated protein [Synechococcus sp. PCC 6312]AFY59277.1 virulence-associated protein [Synechococcus sp. PCC 6312]
MNTAQIKTDGDHQIVILPKEIELSGTEFYIKKVGDSIILISKDHPWQLLFDSLDQFSDDFMETRD